MFPGVILPFKKKPVQKKLFIKTDECEEKNKLVEENILIKKNTLDFPKSSSKKNDWTQYIKQAKPNRINAIQPDNRKFFKSTIVHNDIPNKYDYSFNLL